LELPSYKSNVNLGLGVLLAAILCCWPVESIGGFGRIRFVGVNLAPFGLLWAYRRALVALVIRSGRQDVTPPSRIEPIAGVSVSHLTNGSAIRILPSEKNLRGVIGSDIPNTKFMLSVTTDSQE
jgi:hypothetical protein